jgi:uncharacterized protein YndB with AHSA1/START domain
MTSSSDSFLRMTRRLDASPERVFDALVNPDIVGKWMYPLPDTTIEMDARVGGKWKITNRRDGTDYTALGEYLEVDPPRRLVYTFAMPQFSPNSDTIAIEIEPDGDDSTMTFTHSGVDIAAELSRLPPGEKSGSEQGWEQGFEALAAMFRNNPPA